MTFRVVRTNQYNQDLGFIHSTNGNHLESPNEGSSIDHQVTIHLHAQNITMFPTNETCCYKGRVGKEVSILEREQQLQRCDNHSLRNTVTLYHNDIDRRISQLVEAKKEHKSTQVALEASHMTIVGLTEIGLQDDNGAPAPFDDKWEEEPEEDPEEERLEDIPIDEGDIVDE
ncbi:hypothetical protein F511_17882 [Dorcoceras hygrometricum]|uniref:Uncharacterized protein n=1 Tax=Dorcoceras hygrometricum TaxID=472368 RepID=A0A2Z7CDY8_9LAMI|nr:hypothetical protein F511_17882 [Dorcoceras hygrometricum]